MAAQDEPGAVAAAAFSSEEGSGGGCLKRYFASLVKTALLGSTAAGGKPIELWFQNEARVGQKGTHSHVRAPVCSRPLTVSIRPGSLARIMHEGWRAWGQAADLM